MTNLLSITNLPSTSIEATLIKEKLDNNLICTSYMPINSQLADILTKDINNSMFQTLISKLETDNIYFSAWREVKRRNHSIKVEVTLDIKDKENHDIKN